jgi:hypothetical protein
MNNENRWDTSKSSTPVVAEMVTTVHGMSAICSFNSSEYANNSRYISRSRDACKVGNPATTGRTTTENGQQQQES